uniref:tRNA (guanine(37)-N1)-methyltransferase n=1 Tax=Caenorhabditis tropicalis TaxID=1561998 RepID=A0A1I7UVT9_9PELO
MSILHPPEAIRGMTKLEKDAFRVAVDMPVIEIEARDAGVVSRRVRLEPYLIGHKLKPLKNLLDSEKEGKKYLVFHPDEVQKEETKQKILEMIRRELGEEKALNWETLQKDLTFENWDTKSIFKAVLPEGIEYSSYTQTGHIIHCNFADEILPFRYLIAEVLLNKVVNCKTVVQKGNIITNVYRNLDLELLAGEMNYVTEVKETGLRFKMDFSKVYWNSRLSHEHERVSGMFNNQSLVYDACCGIGPFVLPATMKKKPKRVMANDLNPESVHWLKVNIDLNKIKKDKIEVHNIDAKQFIKEKVAADVIRLMKEESTSAETEIENQKKCEIHVVMNLPAYAVNFLPAFRGVLRQHSSELESIPEEKRWKWNVYCYLFAKSHVDVPDIWYEEESRRMCDEKTKWEKSLVVKCHKVRTVSSRKEMFCAQLELPYDFLLAEPLPEEPDAPFEPEEAEEPCSKRKKTEN